MTKIIVYWLVSFLSLKVLDFLLPQIVVGGFLEVGVFLIVLSLVNLFIKPVLQFFTFPITFLTLGLFSIVVNFFCLWLVIDTTGVVRIETSGVFWFFCMVLISIALSWSNQVNESIQDNDE
jgi:putative membrane protein